jgi:prepilin-type N-terminal cleavage/methylation domain-containing protein
MKKPSSAAKTPSASRAGFTLIELLTVIAIIAILASMVAVAVPKYLEKAHDTKALANMDNVAKALSTKAAETGNTTGYPPAYGFVLPEARDVAVADLLGGLPPAPTEYYVTKPYMAVIGLHAEVNVYEIENWTRTGYDSDGNGVLGLLEFSPVGSKNVDGTYSFSPNPYTGPAGEFTGTSGDPNPSIGTIAEVTEQMKPGIQRPFVYVPFNKRQLNTMRRYWLDPVSPGYEVEGLGKNIDPAGAELAGRLFFPPPNYDGFVLIGVGPGGTNGGVVADPPIGFEPAYAYHYAALRTAFLATRDMDPDGAGAEKADGLRDFDYLDRKESSQVMMLPDGTNGYGAFIKVVE